MQQSLCIQYKTKSIYYRVLGKGKPVVLIHGFAEDGNIWNELIEYLQNNFLLIVPDLPGSGRSEMLKGNISIEDYSEVLKTILDNELPKVSPTGGDLEGAVLIGHSMGGYITLAFAKKYPELLNGFGLFHSSSFADDEEKKQTRLKAIEFIKVNGSYAFLRTAIPKLFAGNKHLKEMEDLIEEGKKFTPEVLIQYYQAMIKRPDTTEVFKTFNKPVLFIIGGNDNAVPMQASLQQCHLPAISYTHILDTGHMGMIEESAGSFAIVQSFLQNI